MSRFTELLKDPFAARRYLVIADPIDPNTIVTGTDISVTGGNTINSGASAFGGFSAGDRIQIVGFSGAGAVNNRRFTISSASAASIVTVEGGMTNIASGDSVGIGASVRKYFSDIKFVTPPSVTTPTGFPEVPGSTYFEARIDVALFFDRSMYNGSAIGGASIPGQGYIDIINQDGELDELRAWEWAKCPVWVMLGGDGFTYDEYGLLLAGVSETIQMSSSSMRILVRDFQAALDIEMQTNKYAGTGGSEGGSALVDQLKPISYGRFRNIEPTPLGIVDGRFAYQFNDTRSAAYDADWHKVYDQGVTLDYVSANPGANQWTMSASASIVTLGGQPAGLITMDGLGDENTIDQGYPQAAGSASITLRSTAASSDSVFVGMYVRIESGPGSGQCALVSSYNGTTKAAGLAAAWSGSTPTTASRYVVGGSIGPIVRRIVTSRPASQPVLVDPTDMAVTQNALFDASALGAVKIGAAPIGYYLPAGGGMLAVLDEIVNSAGVSYGFDRYAKFEVLRFDAPGTSSLTIVKNEILSIDRSPTAAPIRKMTIGYQKNWRVQVGGDVAQSVADNIVTNGNFDTSSGWTFGAGWSWSSANNAVAVAGTASTLSRSISQVNTLAYSIGVSVTRTSGSVQPSVGTRSLGAAISTSGTFSVEFIGGTESTVAITKDAAFVGDVDVVYIRPLWAEFLRREFRTVSSSDTTIFSRNETRVNGVLDLLIDATAEAARQLALFKARRDVFVVTCKIQPFSVDIGDTVTLVYDRWGLNNGRDFTVIAIKESAVFNTATLTLWG